MNFSDLLAALQAEVRGRLRNGELTERGFARRIGLSQSHMHNVLSGVRSLTPITADRILKKLGLTVLDLVAPEDRRRQEEPGRLRPRRSQR